MNATGFSDDYNATFVGNESLDHSDINHTDYDKSWMSLSTIYLLSNVIRYIAAALGIPGNILSAIVWLRLHVTTKNSSAVYLAVLAINDLLWLLCGILLQLIHPSPSDVVYSVVYKWSVGYVTTCTAALEPLVVLSFSIERLIAIVRPLQVCRLHYTLLVIVYHML